MLATQCQTAATLLFHFPCRTSLRPSSADSEVTLALPCSSSATQEREFRLTYSRRFSILSSRRRRSEKELALASLKYTDLRIKRVAPLKQRARWGREPHSVSIFLGALKMSSLLRRQFNRVSHSGLRCSWLTTTPTLRRLPHRCSTTWATSQLIAILQKQLWN